MVHFGVRRGFMNHCVASRRGGLGFVARFEGPIVPVAVAGCIVGTRLGGDDGRCLLLVVFVVWAAVCAV